jgi:hypothetical protein
MSAVKQGVEWTEDEIDTLRSLVEAGVSPSKFSNFLGRSEGSIRARASRSKISLKHLRLSWVGLMPRLESLQEQGYSYEEIAEIVQRSPNAVRGAFYRHRRKRKLREVRKLNLRESVEGILQEHVAQEKLSDVAGRILAIMAEVRGTTDGVVDFDDV